MTQKEFYHSAAWRKTARAYMLYRNCMCERCGAPAEIVHHIRYLNAQNVNDPDIALNPENLCALCHACHNEEHFSSGRAWTAGLAFDADGNLIQDTK